jgi:hypothetical protein
MKIIAILFTWSWGGFVVRYQDGTLETFSPEQLLRKVGEEEYYRLNKIAHGGGMTGHWHKVQDTQ